MSEVNLDFFISYIPVRPLKINCMVYVRRTCRICLHSWKKYTMRKNTQSILYAFPLELYILKTLYSLFLSSYKLIPAHFLSPNMSLTPYPTFSDIFHGLVIVIHDADLNKKVPVDFYGFCTCTFIARAHRIHKKL